MRPNSCSSPKMLFPARWFRGGVTANSFEFEDYDLQKRFDFRGSIHCVRLLSHCVCFLEFTSLGESEREACAQIPRHSSNSLDGIAVGFKIMEIKALIILELY